MCIPHQQVSRRNPRRTPRGAERLPRGDGDRDARSAEAGGDVGPETGGEAVEPETGGEAVEPEPGVEPAV